MGNRTVWVHRIPVNVLSASFTNIVHMPAGAELIHCREQRDSIALWFDVPNQEAPKEQRSFQIYGTGTTIPDDLHYRGTCLFADWDLILHVYEKIEA